MNIGEALRAKGIEPAGIIHYGGTGEEVADYERMGFKKILIVQPDRTKFDRLRENCKGKTHALGVCAPLGFTDDGDKFSLDTVLTGLNAQPSQFVAMVIAQEVLADIVVALGGFETAKHLRVIATVPGKPTPPPDLAMALGQPFTFAVPEFTPGSSEDQCHGIIMGILRNLVPAVREIIEVGLGTSHFLFPLALQSGCRCIVVEPMPAPELLNQIHHARGEIIFVEAALTDADGDAPMTRGRTPDLNSMMSHWWGKGDGSWVPVRTTTLKTLCRKHQAGAIACLKIDVEGGEWDIVKQLRPECCRPAVVMFEYGGTPQNGRQGGWTIPAVDNTCRCVFHLEMMGYRRFMVVEAGFPPTEIDANSLQRLLAEFADGKRLGVFNGADYGNILAILPEAEPHGISPVQEAFSTVQEFHTYQEALRRRLFGTFPNDQNAAAPSVEVK